jgi:hypothetical protein
MQRHITKLVQGALKYTPDDITKAQLCPPCFYTLSNEPTLKPSVLACIDGGNSLKSIDTAIQYSNPRPDDRMIVSPHWIEVTEVDKYKDEVANGLAVNTGKIKSLSNLYLCTRNNLASQTVTYHG